MKLYKVGKIVLTLILVMNGIFGCKTREIENVVNEPALSKHDSKLSKMPTISSDFIDSYRKKFFDAEKKLNSNLDSSEKVDVSENIFRKIIEPLSVIVLNEEYLRDPQFAQRERTALYDILDIFNKSLVMVYNSEPKIVLKSGILIKYNKIVFSECSSNLDGCTNIWYFGRDPQSSFILKIMAQHIDQELDDKKSDMPAFKKSIGEFYRILKMAYSLKNKRLDKDLEFLYIKRARDYMAYYNDLDGASKKIEDQMHKYIFDTIISQYVPENPEKNLKFKLFIENFKPWRYSRLEGDCFGKSTPKIFALGARYFQNEKDIRDAIIEIQGSNDSIGKPFFQRIGDLHGDNKHLFSYIGLDIREVEPKKLHNVYFLIVDRIFRGHLSEVDAISLWEGSKKETNILFPIIDNYLKVEVLRQIEKTNRFMIEIFGRDDLSSDKLFNTVLDHSKNETLEWERLFSRIDSLKAFMDSLFNTSNPSKKYLELKASIERLRANIKYYSVYPNMMLMTYFMAKMDSNLKLVTWFGYVMEIIPSKVISYFFDGLWQPWFLFGNDMIPLKQFEILFAYNFAFKTGAFDTYEKSKISYNFADGFTKLDFFKTVIGGFLNEMKNDLRLKRNDLGNSIIRHTSRSEFNKLCESPEDYVVQIPFTGLDTYVYFGSRLQGPGKIAYDFFQNGYSFQLTSYRVEHGKKIKYVKAMLDLLEDHILTSRSYINQSEYLAKTEELREIQDVLDEVIKLREDFVDHVKSLYKEITGCFRKAQGIESDRQFYLIEEEIKHLERVYETMIDLRQGVTPEHEIEVFNDEITPKYYSYSKYDLMLRVKENLEKNGFARVSMPDQRHIEELDYVKGLTRYPIPFSEDKDKFIRSALNFLSGRDDKSFLKWFSADHSRSIINIKEQQKMLVQLYKFGKISDLRKEVTCYEMNKNECDKYKSELILIDEILDIVSLLNITPFESQILNKLSLNSKYSIDGMKDFIIDSTDYTALPIFDSTYLLLESEQGIKNINLLEEASSLASSIRGMDHFLFPAGRNTCGLIRKNYREIVTGYENNLNNLNFVINLVEKSNDFRIPELTVDHKLDGSRNTVNIINVYGQPRLIKEIRIVNAQRRQAAFHRNTVGFYLPYSGDWECKQPNSPKTCNIVVEDFCKVDFSH